RATDGVGLPNFVGYHSPENYRTPSSIARFIQATLDFPFIPANPLPGMGVRVAAFADAKEQEKKLAHRVQELVRMGFAKDDIVILTVRGMGSSPLWSVEALGSFRVSRFTGEYDPQDRQVMSEGDIRLETVGRFKGQQAPAVILTDVDPRPDRLTEDLERIYTGMTRATMRLEMLVAADNPENDRFMEAG
ncbi:MAG TPA: ATP-binding domain-containing protein, partial [Gammaproteobacteria bacterium]|nr:ATP-binding domain-containing protein [Gammaproteobacteria bacterium]